MSLIPRLLLRPIAKGLAAVFYMMVEHSADTQRAASWTFDHYDSSSIPFGYKARVKVDLIKDESEVSRPKRRVTDIPESAEQYIYD